MIELIPNWHPVWVHFAVALLIIGAVSQVIALLRRPPPGGISQALIVGRWGLWIGVPMAGLALLTGFWAAGSVAHDDVAHANMLVHRNWAIAAGGLFALAALVELLRRSKPQASMLTVLISLAGAAAIGVTGYEGGQNVFEHGLGVQRLPDTGGHDHAAHDHGAAMADAGEDAVGGGDSHGDAAGHDHDDPTDLGSSQPAAVDHSEGHDHGGHDHGEAAPAATLPIDTGALAELAAQLSVALAAGDRAALERLLDPGVLIFESGNVEASRAEYEGHHMPADMAFMAAIDRELLSRKVIELDANAAVVSSRSRFFGSYKDREINSTSTETLVLQKREGQWRIVHIHWSSSG